jgi:hypothetical protein
MTLSAMIALGVAIRSLERAEDDMFVLHAVLDKVRRPAIKPPRPRVELPRERTAMERLMAHRAVMADIQAHAPCAADPDRRQAGTLLRGHLVHRLGSWHGEAS